MGDAERNTRNLNLVALAVDGEINRRYPQLSKRIVYPLRNQQFEIIQETWKHLYNKGRRFAHLNRNAEEEAAKGEYITALKAAQVEKARNFLLVNQKDTNEIPESVKNALISLRLWNQIPIVNGKLMCPITTGLQNVRDAQGRNQNFFAKNGDMLPLTGVKLRAFIRNTFLGQNNEIMRNTTTLKRMPEYRILNTYIRNPNKLGKLQGMLNKDKQAFENPKIMAKRIAKRVAQNVYNWDGGAINEQAAMRRIAPSDLTGFRNMQRAINQQGALNYFGTDPTSGTRMADFLIKKRALNNPRQLFTDLVTPVQDFVINYPHQRDRPI